MYDELGFDPSFDGLVGLGYPSLAKNIIGTPLFDNMMQQALLNDNIFSIYFSTEGDTSTVAEILFGGIDEDLYTGEIYYNDVIDDAYWALQLDDVLIDGESLGVCDQGIDCMIMIDSGTSYLSMPNWAYDMT